MKLNQIFACVLSIAMLMTICACASTPDDSLAFGTVDNIFTSPNKETVSQQETTSSNETSPDNGTQTGNGGITDLGGVVHGFGGEPMRDENGSPYRAYNGGEMVMPYEIAATGLAAQRGVGILLFVDGCAQPYQCKENPTYRYMHTFYPQDGETYITEFTFVPIAGQEGDMLEIYSVSINYPDYQSSYGEAGLLFTSGSVAAGTRIKLNATPESVDYGISGNRVISQQISYVDVTAEEIRGWSDTDLAEKCQSRLYVNGQADNQNLIITRITGEEPVNLRFEIWGSPYVDFGLVFFVDNQPISTDPEDLILFRLQNGQKTVIELQVDLSDFDGESHIYAVLVPRNYRSSAVLTNCFVAPSVTYYLYGDE